MPNQAANATLTAIASVSANAVAHYAASGAPVGAASFGPRASEVFDLSGTVSGSATVSGNAVVWVYLSGTSAGVATLSTPIPVTIMIVSGQSHGIGDTSFQNEFSLSGTAAGTTTLSTPHLVVLHRLGGVTSGVGTLSDNSPLPMNGRGDLTALLQVICIPPPVNCQVIQCHNRIDCHDSNCGVCHWLRFLPPGVPHDRAHISMFLGAAGQQLFPDGCKCETLTPVPCPPKQFRWGHMFGIGDLVLRLVDTSGNPLSAFDVRYTMMRTFPGGAVLQAGPGGKVPVMQKVGLYYATGIAGENGQPGNWIIRWCYRRNFGGPVSTSDAPFIVVDSVSRPVPGDRACRTTKYGWD